MAESRRVFYYYDSEVGNYYYGQGHPMKPHRIRMAHSLILNYNLLRRMVVYRPYKASTEDVKRYHSEDYVMFLQSVGSGNVPEFSKLMNRFNVGEDCPVFDGLFEFSRISAGGSLSGAHHLMGGMCDIAINWAGGLHHAKKCEASGFCYVNDIVLAILEMLTCYQRILYVDIDCHHGDGVEEAFYQTDRVMTISFHKYGDYFPGTGNVCDIGAGPGKYYAVNFPLRDGITDDAYEMIFQQVVGKALSVFRPEAIVLQCGADSLTGDRLGSFNLTIKGHGRCVEYIRKQNLPLLLVGGGGYTVRNVARCWTFETAVALGCDIANDLPHNDYMEFFSPDFRLHIPPSVMINQNAKAYLDGIVACIEQNMNSCVHAPSVPIHAARTGISDALAAVKAEQKDEQEEQYTDQRLPTYVKDAMVAHPGELYEHEDEPEGDAPASLPCKETEKTTETSATSDSEHEEGEIIDLSPKSEKMSRMDDAC